MALFVRKGGSRHAGQAALPQRNIQRPQDRYHYKTPLEVRQEALASATPIEYPIPENKRIKKYKEKWCA